MAVSSAKTDMAKACEQEDSNTTTGSKLTCQINAHSKSFDNLSDVHNMARDENPADSEDNNEDKPDEDPKVHSPFGPYSYHPFMEHNFVSFILVRK